MPKVPQSVNGEARMCSIRSGPHSLCSPAPLLLWSPRRHTLCPHQAQPSLGTSSPYQAPPFLIPPNHGFPCFASLVWGPPRKCLLLRGVGSNHISPASSWGVPSKHYICPQRLPNTNPLPHTQPLPQPPGGPGVH